MIVPKVNFFVIPNSSIIFLNFYPICKNLIYIFKMYDKNNFLQFLNFDTTVALNIRIPTNFIFIQTFCNTLQINQISFFSKIFPFFCNAVEHALLTVSYGWVSIMQLVGFRYQQRWYRTAQVLRYRLGYNKKVWFKCPTNFVSLVRKISPKKSIFYFYFYDRLELNLLRSSVYIARPATAYKGRGVNLKEQPMVLKEGKRALW